MLFFLLINGEMPTTGISTLMNIALNGACIHVDDNFASFYTFSALDCGKFTVSISRLMLSVFRVNCAMSKWHF